jgi:hypothetical protein
MGRDEDDDPVQMLLQLQRMRKAHEQQQQHSSQKQGLVNNNNVGGMEGTVRTNVAKDSLYHDHSTRNSTTTGVEGSIHVAKGSYKGAAHGASIHDEETATENQSLLPDESERSNVPPRKSTALWAKLREHHDSITLDVAPSLDTKETLEQRKSLYEQEMKEEIRSGVEFSLAHCIMAIAVYMGVAVLAFSFVFENWPIVDSIYFATVTFTTIGYGDLAPTSDASRLFTAFLP